MNDESLIQDAIGNKCWYKNNRLHRVNGPAVEKKNGDKEWYLNGKRHREDGPALIYPDLIEVWYFNDKEHRLDGPAKIWADGTKEWWVNGKLHRLEGPACYYEDSERWYIRSIKYEPNEHPFNIFRTQYNLSNKYEEWSNEYKVLFKLIYGGL